MVRLFLGLGRRLGSTIPGLSALSQVSPELQLAPVLSLASNWISTPSRSLGLHAVTWTTV